MAIPASHLVNVVPRVLSGTGTDLVFNGMILTTNENLPASTLLSFNNATEVAEFFGYSSEAYTAAQSYFNGYSDSTLKPSLLFFFRHVAEDSAPFVRGPVSDEAASMFNAGLAISAGTLIVSFSGREVTINNINLSSCGSLSNMAEIVQQAINSATGQTEAITAATVTYDSTLNAFKITGGQKGAQYSVGYCGGDVAIAFRLTESDGAVLSQGCDAETYSETMDKICDATRNFVTFTTLEEITASSEVLELAQWANTQYGAGNQFLYVWHTTDPTAAGGAPDGAAAGSAEVGDAEVTDAGSATTTIACLTEAEYNGTCGVYGDIRYATFIMGCASCINWDAPNATITLAYKKQSGLEATANTEAKATALEANTLNYVGNFAARNDDFVHLQPGCMYGEWRWIDTYINSTWLNNALQVQILAGFESAGRVPYNDTGYAQIRAWIGDVVRRALNNGVIEPGVTLSDTQISELTQEAGRDISAELQNNGYFFQVLDATAQVRQARTTPTCGFWYTYGGSVHRLNIPSTAVV